MPVSTSRDGEETALRALRYFASFAFNVSLFLERIPYAKLASTAKLAASGGFQGRPPLQPVRVDPPNPPNPWPTLCDLSWPGFPNLWYPHPTPCSQSLRRPNVKL